MTDAQLKELSDLRVAIQDLKYQLIHKHRELSDAEIISCMDKADPDINVMTACASCGQRVSSDSVHTCSPQLKFAPLNPPYAGSWVIGGNWHMNVREKPTDEQIKNTELLLGWKWKEA